MAAATTATVIPATSRTTTRTRAKCMNRRHSGPTLDGARRTFLSVGRPSCLNAGSVAGRPNRSTARVSRTAGGLMPSATSMASCGPADGLAGAIAADAERHPADKAINSYSWATISIAARRAVASSMRCFAPDGRISRASSSWETTRTPCSEFLDEQSNGVAWLTLAAWKPAFLRVAIRRLPTSALPPPSSGGVAGGGAARPCRLPAPLRAQPYRRDYVFVHAGVRPGQPLEQQDRRDLPWIRDEF